MRSKKCLTCRDSFFKKENVSKKSWQETKFCSLKCYWKSLKGKKTHSFRHGMTKTRFHNIWLDMKRRCLDPKRAFYHRYGGRGIKVCNKWLSFEGFYGDMHDSYLKHIKEHGENDTTLDRIDNNGDYDATNCRWATQEEQVRNRAYTRTVTYKGKTLTLKEWSAKTGIPYTALSHRHQRGWSDERIVTQPLKMTT